MPTKHPQRNRITRLGWLLLPLMTLAWGINWPIMKVGVSEVPIWTFRAVTALGGAAGLFWIARASGLRLGIPRRERPGLVLAALLNITVFNVLMLYGVAGMASGRAAVLAYTMPLWATLIAVPVLRTSLSGLQGPGLALGLAGMTVLILGDLEAARQAPWATLPIILAAIAWGGGTVVVKAVGFTTPTTVLVAWQLLIGALPVLVVMLLFELDEIGPVSFWPAFAVVYNMIVTAIFCYWAWFRIVAMLPVQVSTMLTLMIPVVGVASGALLLGERPGLDILAALVLVSVAILAVLTPGRARPPGDRPDRQP